MLSFCVGIIKNSINIQRIILAKFKIDILRSERRKSTGPIVVS
jgi:hypothetical protein